MSDPNDRTATLDASKNGNLDIRSWKGSPRVKFVKRVAQGDRCYGGRYSGPQSRSADSRSICGRLNPFGTTATDVVDFFPVLGIATLWFGLR